MRPDTAPTPTEHPDTAAIRAPIAGHIRAARRAAGLTQAELAAAAGTSQGAIARAEGGRHPIAVDRLAEIATALDVEVYDLLGGR